MCYYIINPLAVKFLLQIPLYNISNEEIFLKNF